MKIVFSLFISTLSFSAHAYMQGGLSPLEKSFSARTSHSCYVAKDRVLCWGDDLYGQVSGPNAYRGKNITEVAVGPDQTCLIDDRQIHCYGRGYSTGGEIIKGFNKPSNLALGDGFGCGVDNYRAKCWGPRSVQMAMYQPNLLNVKGLKAEGRVVCAIDIGLECWSDSAGKLYDFFTSTISKPRRVAFVKDPFSNYRELCALDLDVAKCVRIDQVQSPLTLSRRFEDVSDMVAGNTHFCVQVDKERERAVNCYDLAREHVPLYAESAVDNPPLSHIVVRLPYSYPELRPLGLMTSGQMLCWWGKKNFDAPVGLSCFSLWNGLSMNQVDLDQPLSPDIPVDFFNYVNLLSPSLFEVPLFKRMNKLEEIFVKALPDQDHLIWQLGEFQACLQDLAPDILDDRQLLTVPVPVKCNREGLRMPVAREINQAIMDGLVQRWPQRQRSELGLQTHIFAVQDKVICVMSDGVVDNDRGGYRYLGDITLACFDVINQGASVALRGMYSEKSDPMFANRSTRVGQLHTLKNIVVQQTQSLPLDNLHEYISRLIYVSHLPEGRFLTSIDKYLQNSLKLEDTQSLVEQQEILRNRLYVLKSMKLLIYDSTAELFVKSMRDDYNSYWAEARSVYPEISPDPQSTPMLYKTRLILLKSVLDVAKEFYEGDQKIAIGRAMVQTGKSYIDASATQVTELNKALDGIAPLIKKLAPSSKTQFLYDVFLFARTGLEEDLKGVSPGAIK